MSILRRLVLFFALFGGGLYLFAEIVADVGGVIWLRNWMAEEELDKDFDFRTGRADFMIRNGVVYDVTYHPDFVAEPVTTDQILVARKSEKLFDFDRSSWEFTGEDIDFRFKEEGGTASVGNLFVRISDWKGEVDVEMSDVVASADGIAEPLKIAKVVGSFDSDNSPPEFVHLEMSGLNLPQLSESGSKSGGDLHGVLAKVRKELAKLGAEDAEIDIRLTARYERETKLFAIDEFTIDGAGLARVQLTLALKDVSRDIKFEGADDLGALIGVAKIVHGRLDIEDFGLVRQVMEQRAADRSMGTGEAAADVVKRWPISESEKASTVAFLENPHEFSVELAPNKPKRIMDMIMEATFLGQPEEVLRKLGFSATNLPQL